MRASKSHCDKPQSSSSVSEASAHFEGKIFTSLQSSSFQPREDVDLPGIPQNPCFSPPVPAGVSTVLDPQISQTLIFKKVMLSVCHAKRSLHDDESSLGDSEGGAVDLANLDGFVIPNNIDGATLSPFALRAPLPPPKNPGRKNLASRKHLPPQTSRWKPPRNIVKKARAIVRETRVWAVFGACELKLHPVAQNESFHTADRAVKTTVSDARPLASTPASVGA